MPQHANRFHPSKEAELPTGPSTGWDCLDPELESELFEQSEASDNGYYRAGGL